MKVNTSKVIAKVNQAAKAASKSAKAQVASKTAAAPVKAPKQADPLAPKKAYCCKDLINLAGMGLGTNLAVCGREILDGYVTDLLANREKLSSAKLAASDKVLLVASPMHQRNGPRLFAWPVVRAAGDILEVKEDYWKTGKPNTVRTLLSLLKKHVAAVKEGATATDVRLVSKAQALAEMAKAKVYRGSAMMFAPAAK